MNIEKQKENISILLDLIKDNPELEILPMVATECVFSDDYNYWMAEWGEARVDEYCHSDERIYFKSINYDELIEEYVDKTIEPQGILTEEEFYQLAKDKIDGLDWIKAIVVHINQL